ncbi:MAG TPA: hypothetical protein VLX30_12580, partial [Burkholderiales bacterium]|nr:hypothetical protein [Burkholderiales bacterium]
LGAAAERHKQEHRRLIEELESQADALEGRSMSLTMRYLNFWLLHHIESTDVGLAKELIEAPLGDPVEQSDPTQPATKLERWHQAVRRGLWVAPEPRPTAQPPGQLH